MSNYEGTVTWLTINWAKEQFERWVQEVYDDPVGYGFENDHEVQQWQDRAEGIANELGVDFVELVGKYVSKFELERMKQLKDTLWMKKP